jgi:hypothetical protein
VRYSITIFNELRYSDRGQKLLAGENLLRRNATLKSNVSPDNTPPRKGVRPEVIFIKHFINKTKLKFKNKHDLEKH